MKSLIQEAPSIIKAIQQAWEMAGNPVEFSIKILEHGEKNFLGMTRKPAVISFFFEPSFISTQKKGVKKEQSVDNLFNETAKKDKPPYQDRKNTQLPRQQTQARPK